MADRALPPDINPYAPSAVAADAGPGIGVWHEGPLVVMHKDAKLPRICLYTGLPAVGAREFRAVWKGAGDLLSSGKYIYLPLSREPLRAFARARLQSLIGLGLGLVVLIVCFLAPVLAQLGDWVAPAVLLPSLLLGAIGIGLWWVNYAALSEPLKVVYAHGPYLWLAGTHPLFLAHLPAWPAQPSVGRGPV
jgi:hypothetical protein